MADDQQLSGWVLPFQGRTPYTGQDISAQTNDLMAALGMQRQALPQAAQGPAVPGVPGSQTSNLSDIQKAFLARSGYKTPLASLPMPSQDVPSNAAQDTARALAYAKQLNKYGTQGAQYLANTLGSGASLFSGASFPSGLSLFGQGAQGAQFGPGLSLFGQSASGIPSEGFSLTGDAASAAGAAGGLGSSIGSIGTLAGMGLSLGSIINALTSGHGQDQGQYAQAGVSAVPGLVSSLATFAPEIGISGLAGPVLGAALLPMMIPAIENLVHMFGDPNLPYHSGNMSQFKSRQAAEGLPKQLNQYLLGVNDPRTLLGITSGAFPLSPHGELAVSAGGQPMGSEGYNKLLQGVLSGDPNATQQFLRSVQFMSGETGRATDVERGLTDTYRRQLAHALGMTNAQVQGAFDLPQTYGQGWREWTNGQRPEDRTSGIRGWLDNTVRNMAFIDQGGIPALIQQIADPNFAYGGEGGYASQYYRDPYFSRLRPEEVPYWQNELQSMYNSLQQPQSTYVPSGD